MSGAKTTARGRVELHALLGHDAGSSRPWVPHPLLLARVQELGGRRRARSPSLAARTAFEAALAPRPAHLPWRKTEVSIPMPKRARIGFQPSPATQPVRLPRISLIVIGTPYCPTQSGCHGTYRTNGTDRTATAALAEERGVDPHALREAPTGFKPVTAAVPHSLPACLLVGLRSSAIARQSRGTSDRRRRRISVFLRFWLVRRRSVEQEFAHSSRLLFIRGYGG